MTLARELEFEGVLLLVGFLNEMNFRDRAVRFFSEATVVGLRERCSYFDGS